MPLFFMDLGRDSINVAYIVSVTEDSAILADKIVTHGCIITTVDGATHIFDGTKDEFFQKLREGLEKGGVGL